MENNINNEDYDTEPNKPNYYAVIPANVRYDNNLKLGEKMMYGEISALSNKTGICNASNNYFARLYNVSPQAISKWIKHLEEQGYIEISYIKNGKIIKKRLIKMVSTVVNRVSTGVEGGINCGLGGYQQEIKENNTSINNTSINNKENIYISNDIYIKEFENLWNIYPNKKGKTTALRKYINARKKGTTYEEVEQGIVKYNEQIEENRTNKQYIKHGSSWFNQECWNDEYDTNESYLKVIERECMEEENE